MDAFCGKRYLCFYKCTVTLFFLTALLGLAGIVVGLIPGNDTVRTTTVVVNACGGVTGTMSAIFTCVTGYAHLNGPDKETAEWNGGVASATYFMIMLSVGVLIGGNFLAIHCGHGWYGAGITGFALMLGGSITSVCEYYHAKADYLERDPDAYWTKYDLAQERAYPEKKKLRKYRERYWNKQGLNLNKLEKAESLDEATRKKLVEAAECSISLQIPENPVVTRSGQIYDRDALTRHFMHQDDRRDCFCPNTRTKLTKEDIIPFDQLGRVLKKHIPDNFDSNESISMYDPQAERERLLTNAAKARKRLLECENTTRTVDEM